MTSLERARTAFWRALDGREPTEDALNLALREAVDAANEDDRDGKPATRPATFGWHVGSGEHRTVAV